MLLTDVLSRYNELYSRYDDVDNKDSASPDNGKRGYNLDNRVIESEFNTEPYSHDNPVNNIKAKNKGFTHDNRVENSELRRKASYDAKNYAINVKDLRYKGFTHDNKVELKDINSVNYNHENKFSVDESTKAFYEFGNETKVEDENLIRYDTDIIHEPGETSSSDYTYENNVGLDTPEIEKYQLENETYKPDNYQSKYKDGADYTERKANLDDYKGKETVAKISSERYSPDGKVTKISKKVYSYGEQPNLVEEKVDLKKYANQGTTSYNLLSKKYNYDGADDTIKVNAIPYKSGNDTFQADTLDTSFGGSSINIQKLATFWDETENALSELVNRGTTLVNNVTSRGAMKINNLIDSFVDLPNRIVTNVLDYGYGVINNLFNSNNAFILKTKPKKPEFVKPTKVFDGLDPEAYSAISWTPANSNGKVTFEEAVQKDNTLAGAVRRTFEYYADYAITKRDLVYSTDISYPEEIRNNIQRIYRSGLAVEFYWDITLGYHLDEKQRSNEIKLPGIPWNWFPADSFSLDGDKLKTKQFSSGDVSIEMLTNRIFPKTITIDYYDNMNRDYERFWSDYLKTINYISTKKNRILPYDEQAFDITIYIYYQDRTTELRKLTYVGIPNITLQTTGSPLGTASAKAKQQIVFSIIGLGFDNDNFDDDLFESFNYFGVIDTNDQIKQEVNQLTMGDSSTSGGGSAGAVYYGPPGLADGTGYSTEGFGSEGVVSNYKTDTALAGSGYSTDGTGSAGVVDYGPAGGVDSRTPSGMGNDPRYQ